MTCCQGESVGAVFDRAIAERELRRFQRRGPIPSTRLLIDALESEKDGASTLLDIGGGIGAIHHALLDTGVAHAVQVDLSSDYIAVAHDEARRRGHDGSVEFVHADFLNVASEIAPADVVTLDRAICCYPDMERLVGTAAEKTRRIFGAVYPRDVWWVRVGAAMVNLMQRIRRADFRVYVHSPAAIDGVLRRHGLARQTRRRTFVWEIVTYRRNDA